MFVMNENRRLSFVEVVAEANAYRATKQEKSNSNRSHDVILSFP
jgi:hypothetical protein